MGEGELPHEVHSGICEPLRNPPFSLVTVRLVPFGDSFHKPGALLWRCPGLHELEGRGQRTEDRERRTEKGDDKIAINAEQRPVIVIRPAHGPNLWQRLPPPAKFIDIPTPLNTPEHPLHTPCLTSPNVNPARP